MPSTEDNETNPQKVDISIQTDAPKFYEQAEQYIQSFQSQNNNNSSIIDIIGIYIKGQKILYTEAKTLCEQRLTALMLPSILFTVVCSISNLWLKDYVYGSYINSALSGSIAFILAVINYMKLDARAEAHRSSAYKFDKLVSYVEFQSGKLLFLTRESARFGEIISKIEKDVTEIKETNQFVLPEKIRFSFPYLSSVNIFTLVKRIQGHEIQYTHDLGRIMEKIYELKQRIDNSENENERIHLIKMVENYEHNKYELTRAIIDMQQKYLNMDEDFETEMESYRKAQSWRPMFLDLFKV
jgi:hypothetical protein